MYGEGINTPVFLEVEVTEEFVAISTVRKVVTVDIEAPSTNSDPVYIKGLKDVDGVALLPSVRYSFARVDLLNIYVKGTPGDVVNVVGNTVQQ